LFGMKYVSLGAWEIFRIFSQETYF
jgi:hypothetical protein